jgi:hypothetical protein
MASVYLETNGASTVNDASGTVLVDVPSPSPPVDRSQTGGGQVGDRPTTTSTAPEQAMGAGDVDTPSQAPQDTSVGRTAPDPADWADLIDRLFSL